MRFFGNLFEKKYLEWDEYINKVEEIDERAFRRNIKKNNEKIRKEILKRMNFSG